MEFLVTLVLPVDGAMRLRLMDEVTLCGPCRDAYLDQLPQMEPVDVKDDLIAAATDATSATSSTASTTTQTFAEMAAAYQRVPLLGPRAMPDDWTVQRSDADLATLAGDRAAAAACVHQKAAKGDVTAPEPPCESTSTLLLAAAAISSSSSKTLTSCATATATATLTTTSKSTMSQQPSMASLLDGLKTKETMVERVRRAFTEAARHGRRHTDRMPWYRRIARFGRAHWSSLSLSLSRSPSLSQSLSRASSQSQSQSHSQSLLFAAIHQSAPE